jgi:hypothetical protein
MANQFGIPDQAWAAAREEMRSLLKRRARIPGAYPYSELLDDLELMKLDTHSARDRAIMSQMLVEIGESEHQAGRPLLPSIVIHKSGDQEPGPGFAKLASRLGIDASDPQQMWIDQFKRTWKYWGQKTP